ncbi:MAG: AAA family ATPase [Candidatus Faecivicinus sp.]
MNYQYVAIEREYGSCGLEIGRLVARQFGIPCYNGEILNLAAQKACVSTSRIERMEQNIADSYFYSLYMESEVNSPSDQDLHLALQSAIQELAASGPAVFVGHSAQIALQPLKETLSVFVYADRQFRVNRLISEHGFSAGRASEEILKSDRRRSNYFYYCTGAGWDSTARYDLLLNSGKIGVQGCAAALIALLDSSC